MNFIDQMQQELNDEGGIVWGTDLIAGIILRAVALLEEVAAISASSVGNVEVINNSASIKNGVISSVGWIVDQHGRRKKLAMQGSNIRRGCESFVYYTIRNGGVEFSPPLDLNDRYFVEAFGFDAGSIPMELRVAVAAYVKQEAFLTDTTVGEAVTKGNTYANIWSREFSKFTKKQ